MRFTARTVVTIAGLAAMAVGCGSDNTADEPSADAKPTVVVTTNILGDVVENLVGEEFNVVTIMPVGADPHGFQPSAKQVSEINDADALIVNGGDFEQGLLDVIASVDNDTPVFEAIDAVATLEFGDHDEDEHDDESEHADEEHGDDHDDEHDDHGHEGEDPHFFTDPARMTLAANGIVDFLVDNVATTDAAQLRANAQTYIDELESLDAEVSETLAVIPADDRVLITNHEVFGYFADRYDFEVVGTVIPTGATTDGASAESLADLAKAIEQEGVQALFADTSSSDELAQTLAAEVGDVEVVELFSESLGEPGEAGASYLDMVRVNAQRIADALAS